MFLNLPIYAIPKKMKVGTFTVLNNGVPKMIFPAMHNKNVVELAGENQGTSNLSPIVFNGSRDVKGLLNKLLDYFFDKGVRKVRLIKIKDGSFFDSFFDEDLEKWSVDKKYYDNVKIEFKNGFEDWHSRLSKSVRQNLRTAFNRLKTDGKEFEAKVYRGGKIPRRVMHKMVSIYNNCHTERYGTKVSLLKKFYLQHLDFSTRDFMNNPDAIHYALYIQGELAAFFSGYVDQNMNSIIVPRLSIDRKFSRYSPGYILLKEAISDCDKNGIANCIDLSRGIEKYKTDLGGIVYRKLDISLSRK